MAKTIEELEMNLKAVTDRLTVLDRIIDAAKLGVDMRMVFQCNHSGLFFEDDYIKQWGRLYGIGLGPNPVSEVLDTDYFTDPPPLTNQIRNIEQISHPVGHCLVQVDMHLVEVSHFESKRAIVALQDPFMDNRMRIIHQKQAVNPASKMKLMRLQWERIGGK